jgi:hypothetical protein
MKTRVFLQKYLIMLSVSFILSIFILFAPASADPLDNWHLRNPLLPQVNSFNGVTYGNGIFVAVGEYGIILTSPNGMNWTERNLGITLHLNGVTYEKDIFVAIGNKGTILTSPDGMNWTERSSGTTSHLNGITHGNGIFVAVGDRILTSPDGIGWTERRVEKIGVIYPWFYLSRVAYGNGIFVAVGDRILTSPDGVNWTERSTGTDFHASLFGVAYGNGTFVTVGEDCGAFRRVFTSPDGVNWTERNTGTDPYFYLIGVTYGKGIFVAVGDRILTSPDGVNWTERNSGDTAVLHEVTYGSNTFVAVGSSNTILQSDPLTNNPPSKPELVFPANNQTGLGMTITFIWKKSTDPDGDAIAYNLYVCEDQSFIGCNPIQTTTLYESPYYFIVFNGSVAGLFFIGIMISFVQRKRKIYLILAVLLITGMLIVSCGGGDGGTSVAGDEISHTVSGHKTGTTHYWKVVTDDSDGGTTESDIWNFTTQ